MSITGVLALQGCIDPHIQILKSLGASCCPVRNSDELASIDRIILPGGESSTMLNLLKRTGLFEQLREFGRSHPVWGICAGAILLAREVIHPRQDSLALADIRATRNFYGCQLDSFKTTLHIEKLAIEPEVDFIRAPRLEPISAAVAVLARHGDNAVLMQQGRLLVSSFHVELTSESRLHKYFLSL